MNNFKDVRTRIALANLLGVPENKLTYVLYIKKIENLYTSFSIPKKNGESRHINAPQKDLKDIQKKLADCLYEYQKENRINNNIKTNISHAFERDKSFITNAKVHRNKRFVYNVDLENFFGSFHFGRVKGFFEKNKDFQLPSNIATVISQIACYQGELPQGAPSSPIITNLICNIFDIRLIKLAKKYKLDYTRYADDLTFSTNNKKFLDTISDFHSELSKEIKQAGFEINNNKTRLQFQDSKQEVTGLTVNKKLNVDKSYFKTTRAMAHHLYTQGSFKINDKDGTINQLEGRFAFINQLDRYNNKLDNGSHNIRELNSRERQYQKFLFYKYFYANNKPIIVTEGKTDILYLKAAIKKFHSEYPALINKRSDGKFEFKISFLRRTKRLNYFLDLQKDGANTMKKLYNFFSNKESRHFPNYSAYFKKNSVVPPKNPVIFVYDNELKNKKKPIIDFLNYANIKPEKRLELAEILSIKIINNLFLLTNPLIVEPESEIEDLFDEKTLSIVLNGKTFSRNDDSNDKEHYGKEIFSKHISSNYSKINFDNFRPMLDRITAIMETYEK